MRFLALCVALAFAAPADAGPIRNLIARLRGPDCRCQSCNCAPCPGKCEGPLQASRPPLISVTEQMQIRGRTFGYTIQSQRPFLQIQAGQRSSCPGGVCPLP